MRHPLFGSTFRSRRLLQYLPAALLLLTAVACLPEGQESKATEASPFYDLERFFEEEVDRLQRLQPAVNKTVSLDGQSQFQQFDSLNYNDELSVFQNSDINRAAWWDKYAIDSTFAGEQLSGIRYSAKSEELKIRSVDIGFDKGNVARVAIESRTDSPTATMDRKLRYEAATGYRIETRQNVTFSKPREMIVEVSFRE